VRAARQTAAADRELDRRQVAIDRKVDKLRALHLDASFPAHGTPTVDDLCFPVAELRAKLHRLAELAPEAERLLRDPFAPGATATLRRLSGELEELLNHCELSDCMILDLREIADAVDEPRHQAEQHQAEQEVRP
jgi:hypothetical protein